jgi:hypothetical protein
MQSHLSLQNSYRLIEGTGLEWTILRSRNFFSSIYALFTKVILYQLRDAFLCLSLKVLPVLFIEEESQRKQSFSLNICCLSFKTGRQIFAVNDFFSGLYISYFFKKVKLYKTANFLHLNLHLHLHLN